MQICLWLQIAQNFISGYASLVPSLPQRFGVCLLQYTKQNDWMNYGLDQTK